MARKRDPLELNKREKDILKFIETELNENGYPPSVREIGKAVGLKSTATVHSYLGRLEDGGYISRKDKKGIISSSSMMLLLHLGSLCKASVLMKYSLRKSCCS